MNRRSFIKRISLLAGFIAVNPTNTIKTLLDTVPKVVKHPASWKSMILEIYPNEEGPLTKLLKENKNEGIEFSWWNDKITDRSKNKQSN